MLVKPLETSSTSFFIECALCEAHTKLGSDRLLLKRTPEAAFLHSRQTTPWPSRDSFADVEAKMKQLMTPSDAVMPRNIKLLVEYDASIGKDGLCFIPIEHWGLLSYGTPDGKETDASLSKWNAMIIGPQGVSWPSSFHCFPISPLT